MLIFFLDQVAVKAARLALIAEVHGAIQFFKSSIALIPSQLLH